MNVRLQLNSKKNKINVFKQMPTTEDNQRYTLAIESLTVPPMTHGLILNQPLFTVERRLVLNEEWAVVPLNNAPHVPHVSRALPAGDWTFTPQNVKTISQLLYQMNHFFRKKHLQAVTSLTNWVADATVNAVPAAWEQTPNEDWFARLDTVVGILQGRDSLQAIYRSDGRIAIKFSPEAAQMYVLLLTAEGQRILGWDKQHIAVDNNSEFKEEYTAPVASFLPAVDHTLDVVSTAPALTESIICVLNNSVFNQGHYRHELVILATIPLRNYLECDNRTAQYKNQLASYRYPSEPIQTKYRGTLFKTLVESRKNKYLFEKGNKTHNQFLLTASTMQNFHLDLVSRNYTWSEAEKKFIITDVPYPLPPESMWTIQLLINQLS